MSDFYLTLPSNNSMEYYTENTLAQFTSRLPNAINLSGDWEVGLVEIQYPHNWFNVPTLKRHRTFTVRATATTDANAPLVRRSFYIRAGYYPHIYDLLTEIQEKTNEALSDVNNSIRLNYDRITRKISVTFSRPCSLSLPMHIGKMIGLTRGSWDATNSNGGEVSDLDPVDSLFVYCDVLEHWVVGDSQVPLLRIVPVEGRNGELLTWIYENVHYVRLQRKTFQTIEINIRDRAGINVPFEAGTLNVTLHFRQRKRLSTL